MTGWWGVAGDALLRFVGGWRLSLRIVGLGLRAKAEYRAEFVLMVLIGAVWQVSLIVFVSVVLVRFPGLGGWSTGDVLLVASGRLLSHGLFVAVFGSIGITSVIVQEGRIEGFQLRPVPVYRQVMLYEVPTNAIGDLLVATGLFAGALARVGLVWTFGRICYLAAMITGGMFLEAAIMTVVSAGALHLPTAVYWRTWLEEFLATFGNYPLSILPRLVGNTLTFVLPIAFIAYLPAAVLTGHATSTGLPLWLLDGSPAAGLLAYLGSRWLWAWSLRHYQGIGG